MYIKNEQGIRKLVNLLYLFKKSLLNIIKINMPKAPGKYFTEIFIQSHSKSLHKNRYMFKNIDTKNMIRYKYFRYFRFSM